MKRLIALVLLCSAFLLPYQAFGGFEKPKIAVLDFELQGDGFETKDIGSMVAEWFITALVKTGRFEVVERTLLKKIIEEQELSNSTYASENTAAKLGEVLGVKVIISGSVIHLGNVTEVNARIIDVESATVIAAENVKGYKAGDLHDLVNQMSEKISKNFPLEGYIVSRKDKKVTVDLGVMTGVKSSMDFIVYKEGNIIKHPKTGEILDVELLETGRVTISNVHKKISSGEIIREVSPGAVKYGQLIKSLSAPLKPLTKEESRLTIEPSRTKQKPKKKSTTGSTATTKKSQFSKKESKYAKMLVSNDIRKKTDAAKLITREKITATSVLDIVEKELLAGYKTGGKDRNHIDSMSWMCNALGASGNPKYEETLKTVYRKGSNRKLRKYAKKALSTLKKNR